MDKAVAKIDDLMKQDLPNLVDERRFRRPREPDPNIERDEFGRVCRAVYPDGRTLLTIGDSVNGPRRRSP